MLGKRPRPFQRASRRPHLVRDDAMPTPAPKHLPFDAAGPPAPATAAPRQVFGFNPVIKDVDAGGSPRSVLEANSVLAIRNGCLMPGKQARSPRSPRSGLESLRSSPRPWDKKDGERVGLGIVAALHTAEGDASWKARGVVETSKGLLANAGPLAEVMPPNVFQPHGGLYAKESRPIPIAQASQGSTRDCRGHQQRRVVEEASEDGRFHESLPWTSSKSIRCPFKSQQQPSLCCAPADMEVESRKSIFSTASPASSFNENTCPLPAIDFLNACYFCKRRLGPGRDIYMYRGDRAFCSAECRYQQIVIDERKERCQSAAFNASTVGASIRRGTLTTAYAY